MARPRRCRRVCLEPAYDSFIPSGIICGKEVILTVDEYEAIRLMDLEGFTHEQCASQMDISRTTVTEIYEAARRKIADSIVHGRPLTIAGGSYRICDGQINRDCKKTCRWGKHAATDGNAYRNSHLLIADMVHMKGENEMRIAVTYENGQIFQHFGHTEQFKIYDIADGQITREQVMDTNGSGHGALAGFLAELKVDALICGGIGKGAQMALANAGIKLYGGVSGDANHAVKALVEGTLSYDPDARCSHHDHDGQCGGHHGNDGEYGGHGHDGECGGHGHDGECGGHGNDGECGGHGHGGVCGSHNHGGNCGHGCH